MASRKTEQNITSSGDVEAATRMGKAGSKAEEKSATKPRTQTTRNKQVTVTFNVNIPEMPRGFNEKVYLVGTLRQFNHDLPDWDPRGVAMKKVAGNQWTVTLKGNENSAIEYKYVLGGWDHVEKDGFWGEIPNRRVTLAIPDSGILTIDDTVQAWNGLGNCK